MNDWVRSVAQNLLAQFLWVIFASLVTLVAVRGWNRWQRHKRLRELYKVADDSAVALCIRVGGRGDPVPDVKRYLEVHQPRIRVLMIYSAPVGVDLTDPDVSLAIVEDFREAVSEFGSKCLSEVHLFASGMVAYPFALGAMLGNWCPIVMYHLLGEGKYVPLYRLTKEFTQGQRRLTGGVAQLRVETIAPASASPSEPAIAAAKDSEAGLATEQSVSERSHPVQ